MYNMQFWETSGHAANYKDNMFVFEVEKQEFALKPMNCLGHCLMFDHRVPSYRDDDDDEYEEGNGGNRLLGFMFGNVDGSRDLHVDYLDEDIDMDLEREHDLHALNMDFAKPVAPSNLDDATEENENQES
ncbi:Threonine--tRNA ligase [Nymphaea thermarum]|nr:Threonine--tRNA ligase [Nymphaea thermarum]